MAGYTRRPSSARPVVAGDTVLVYSPWSDEWVEGTVRVPMDRQFSWTNKQGEWFYTFYDGDWKHAN